MSASTTPATATATPSIKRTILQAIPIPSLPGWESRLVLLEYPPGASAPPHTHPVASTGYVVSGAVASQWEGEGDEEGVVERYEAGESFVDHGGRVHLRSENVSPDGGVLRFVASYVIRVGEANVEMMKE